MGCKYSSLAFSGKTKRELNMKKKNINKQNWTSIAYQDQTCGEFFVLPQK